jgi:hypothetical protein
MNIAAEQTVAVKTLVENRLYSTVVAVNAALGMNGSYSPVFGTRSAKTRTIVPVATQTRVKTADAH